MALRKSKSLYLPGVLLGIGLGGFFDGIAFYQLLQWHHMVSNTHVSAADLQGLRFNVMLDSLFHAYLFTLAGLWLLWRRHITRGQRDRVRRSSLRC